MLIASPCYTPRRKKGRVALWVVAFVAVLLLTPAHLGWAGAKAPAIPPVDAKITAAAILSPLDEVDTKLEETLTQSFRERFKAVLEEAKDYLSEQCTPNAAVVLDLDETLMDNRAYFVIHKRYDTALWDAWMQKAEAPAIPETLEFVSWLNKKGYNLYFVTGRKERFREVTTRNLARMGVNTFDGLFMKPDDYSKDSASDFKLEARKAIEARGQKVLMILGDQESDLRGGTGKGFKLPNPIYYIP